MANDPVNHPAHYTDGKYEVIEFIEDQGFGFHYGNAVKYISRAGKKDPDKMVEDLNKAIWYLDRARHHDNQNYVYRHGLSARSRCFAERKIDPVEYCKDKNLSFELTGAIQHICSNDPVTAIELIKDELETIQGVERHWRDEA